MEQMLQVYPYCIFLLIFFILLSYCACVAHIKRYIRCHGYGVVTCLLLNLVSTQLAASFLCMTSSIFLLMGDPRLKTYVTLFNDGGTSWLISTSLLHVIGITCLRIYSASYGSRFQKFVASSSNVGLVVVKLWFVGIAMTAVTVTSGTPMTNVVFHGGVAATGVFSIIAYSCTANRKPKNRPQPRTEFTFGTPILPQFNRDTTTSMVTRQNKTSTMFTGLVVLFTVFTYPVVTPHIIYNAHALLGHNDSEVVSEEVSVFLTLWCLLGVMANLVWLCCRMRANLNDVTGLPSLWSLEGRIGEEREVGYDETKSNGQYERLQTLRKQIM